MLVMRLALVFCVMALLAWVGRDWLVAVGYHAQHLWTQRQAANIVLPPGTVVFTEDLRRITTFSGDDAYRRDPFQSQNHPERWERIGLHLGMALREPAASRVQKYVVGGIFGAERTSVGGHTWIVTLGRTDVFAAEAGGRVVHIAWRTFKPVGWTLGARGAATSRMGPKFRLTPSDRLTIFAAHADPNRTDHVTVPYELNGHRGCLGLTLRDDGTLAFQIVDGPAVLAP